MEQSFDEKTGKIDSISISEIEIAVNRAAVAAELFVAADLLAEHLESKYHAQDQYSYLTFAYPETDVAAKAKKRLRSLLERSE